MIVSLNSDWKQEMKSFQLWWLNSMSCVITLCYLYARKEYHRCRIEKEETP